jgi:hypothetical protein
MIATTDKSAPGAFVDTNGQRHFLLVAAIAANLTRVSWVHSFKRPASVFSFAFRYREKSSPSHVADCLREAMVFHHPSNVQIFNCDRVKSSYKIGRNLMVKILATARYFQVRLGDYDSLFGAPLRSIFLARKPPLLSLQLMHRVLEMARVLDLFAGRERGETGDADIHSNGLPGRRQWLRFRHLANNQRIPAVNAACDPKLFALPFDHTGKPDSTGSDAGNREFVAFDRAGTNLLVFLREGVIAVFALESEKPRPLSILETSKETFKSFPKAFERILLDCPQMAFHFRQRASFSQMTRLFDIAKRRAGDLITGDSLSESGVVDLARVFEFTIARFYKAFVGAKLELESLDSGIFRISHCVSRLAGDVHWRDLEPGCSLISGRCAYTTTGQSIKQQNSEWNALRTREIARRWPISIPLRFTAEGGGSFTATLRRAHSKEPVVDNVTCKA